MGIPTVVQQKQIRLVSMLMWVQSLALLSGGESRVAVRDAAQILRCCGLALASIVSYGSTSSLKLPYTVSAVLKKIYWCHFVTVKHLMYQNQN